MRTFFTLLVLALIGGIIYLYMISQRYPWDFVYDFESNKFYSFDVVKEDLIDTLGDQSGKDARAYHEAISKKDEDLCANIKSKSLKKTCRVDITIQKAKDDGSEEICETLTWQDDKKRCNNERLHSIALRTSNKVICDQIVDNMDKHLRCIEDVDSNILNAILESDTADERVCDTLGDSFFRECITHIKKNKTAKNYTSTIDSIDKDDCTVSSDPKEKQKCQDNKLFEKAKKTSDVTTCTGIQDEEIKQKCIQQVSYTNDMVFFKSAKENKKLNICNKIVDTNMKVQCRDLVLLDMAQSAKNTAFCSSIQDETLKQECNSIR